MPRLVSASRLCEQLTATGDVPSGYRELAHRLEQLVVDGRLSPGTRLPSERELTAALGVSRTTVTRGYAELRAARLLTSYRGSGSTVTVPHANAAAGRLAPVDVPGAIGWTIAAGAAAPGVGRAYADAAAALPAYLDQTGYLMTGVPLLRELLAARYTARGLPTDPDQLVITSGAQSAVGLVLRALAGRGDRVLMDSPTYPNAIEAVRREGLRPVAVPLDDDGWHLASLDAALRQSAPRLAYLIPDFHNPTGQLMDAGMRAALGATLRRHRTTAIVDETLAELTLDASEDALPPPFAATSRDAVTIGSASKSFWGGMRIGWVRAGRDLVDVLVETRPAADLGAPVLEQLVLVELLRRRTEVLTEQRSLLRRRRDTLVELLADRFGDWQLQVPSGGLSLWVRLPERVSTKLVMAAAQEGLVLTAGPRFFVDGGGERHLRLPFARERDDLAEAVDRLARAYAPLRQRAALPSV